MNDIMYGRKAKGIKEELRAKIIEWCSAISDKELVEDIKRDAIVTGGAIASMLLGESVNDYDIYFKTKATTIKVAEYYTKLISKDYKLHNLSVKDGDDRVIIRITSSGVVDTNEKDRINEAIKAIPLSMISKKKKEKSYYPTYLSQNAITLTDDIQIIVRFFGDHNEIHENFDFAHAMCWYSFEGDNLELSLDALECLLSRTLKYNGSLYPVASVFRTKKFLNRGWRISASELLKMMWQISELDLTDIEVLQEQLTGVDVSYMEELVQVLSSLDKSQLNATHVGKIIDKVFE